MSRRAASRRERGAVTVELALGIPVLLGLTLVLSWMLALAVAQVRVVDAAREAARVTARGEAPERATEVARRIAPAGAQVRVRAGLTDLAVEVSVRVDPPVGLGGLLPGPEIRATAHAVPEQSDGGTA